MQQGNLHMSSPSPTMVTAERTLPPAAIRTGLSRDAQRGLYRVALVLGDLCMLAVAFAIAYEIRFIWLPDFFDPAAVPSVAKYRQIALLLSVAWVGLFAAFRLYNWQILLGGIEEYARVGNAVTAGAVGVMIFSFMLPAFVIARGWLVLAWALAIVTVLAMRLTLRHLVYGLRERGYFLVPALVIGSNEEAITLATSLQSFRHTGLYILGFIDTQDKPVGQLVTSNLPILGHLDDIQALIERHQVEEIIVATSALPAEKILDIFRRFGIQGTVSVRLSSGMFDVLNTNLHVKELGIVPLITVNKVRLSPEEALVKTLIDRIGAAAGLILLSPILAAIAVAIKLTSPGPIIYRRRVLGQGGKPFDALKFRTMYTNGDSLLTEEQWATLQREQKLKDDPRVTPIGKFLRKYSLDELPQFWNVLKGEMSLIGPRMITPEEHEKYGKWDANLLTVKPGMSGLWQVSGRSDVSYEERVRMDMHYIRNYNIWLDLHLIVRTIFVVIKGKGAY